MAIQDFLYGSVLKVTREDTAESIERQFSMMKESGLNTVVIWPAAFWWEEKTAEYPFRTGKMILRLAERYGLRIIMELAGQLSVFEYIPDFKMKEEYYAVDELGHRELGQSSFGFLNYFHPEVNDQICAFFQAAANAYKEFPALIGYDVFNETMYRSFDPWTMQEFRVWLREKYGTLEKLNQVWERTYGAWDQVQPENWMWMSVMPRTDYCAFRKAAVTRFMKNWCDAIRKADTEHFLIADNIHSMVTPAGSYDRPQDDFALLDVVDEIGMSFYPKQVKGCMEPAHRWETFDAFYAASKRNGFMISEMQTHIQAMFNPTTAVRPYELRHWCLEAAAGGAKGIVYWMWRQFDKGLQTLGRGLVDYRGKPTERLEAAAKIQEELQGIAGARPVRSKIAILYDPQCEDFQRAYTAAYPVDQNLYLNSILGAYKAFWERNVRCDIIRMDSILDYQAVILTNHIIVSAADAEILKDYVKHGGTLIVDGKFAVADEESMTYSLIPGAGLHEAAGYIWLDTDYEQLNFTWKDRKLCGYYTREKVEHTADAEGSFEDGSAAVMQNAFGRGKVFTINTNLWYRHAKENSASALDTVDIFADTLHLQQIRLQGKFNVRVSETDKEYVLFVFNYTDMSQSGAITEVMGKNADIPLAVEAHGAEIIRIEK